MALSIKELLLPKDPGGSQLRSGKIGKQCMGKPWELIRESTRKWKRVVGDTTGVTTVIYSSLPYEQPARQPEPELTKIYRVPQYGYLLEGL